MKKVVFASLLAVASSSLCCLPVLAQGQSQGAQPNQITIKDPAEYNAYSAAISQSDPTQKAAAIEQFLTQYPNSVVKTEMLEQLVAAYQGANNAPKVLDAAQRLLQVDPNDLRALIAVVYLEHAQAKGNQQLLDDASAKAQQGLNVQKPASMTDADFQKIMDLAKPTFYNAVGSDDAAKKDYKGAIAAYTSELKSYKDPAQTTSGTGLLDTYYLGNAYLQQDPKDLVNGIWFLTRAAQYAPAPFKDNIEKAAEYWYNKYHGAMDGFPAIQQLAHDNLFPPDSYKPVPAPPPPSPQDLAHNAVTSTPDLNTLALADKEFILSNGTPDDAQKVWAVLQGKTAEVPGVVVSATADSVQIAVSQDAQQSQKADFTVNMKTPLKEVPAQGAKVTYIATFDSYTQNPPMIILKDGALKPEKKAPVHHTAARRRSGM
ncbi:hypothetical protein [Paracidobacterium acidisoli]|uniref:Tetratricopeptide repeat protein n=1 Tax=Paracidobacterium acidisoli TaxID=2303751 RepID=A0A372IUC1_9BACT|nr:hypothetical protein [Paracidobacterium acidisoli]MBT9329850.1 hypothetical protein [Paracidobacterium acidisoli]